MRFRFHSRQAHEDQLVPTLLEFPPLLLRVFALALGLVWGSFLNVVIYRVPRGESVVRPSSHCPACGKPIAPWNNLPVLSWLVLRGRARCCGARIPVRYMLVEAAGGLLALALVEAVLLPMAPETSLAQGALVFFSSFALGMGLMAAAFIDLDHMYIPDSISIGAILLGIATFWLRPPLSLTESLAASAAGFLLVWLLFGVFYRWVRGRTGMGLGDAKLLAVAGAWFGWKGMLFALLAGAVQGTIAAVLVLVVRGRIDEPEAVQAEREALLAEVAALQDDQERAEAEEELRKDPLFESTGSGAAGARIAFGPFLVLGIIEYLLVGDTLIHSYVTWLGY